MAVAPVMFDILADVVGMMTVAAVSTAWAGFSYVGWVALFWVRGDWFEAVVFGFTPSENNQFIV